MHVSTTEVNHPLREQMGFIFQVSAVSIDLEMPILFWFGFIMEACVNSWI